ncbi:hypothetical protein WR25_02914 [Diploscapter pachys]|uniref:Battenin n=1 Tax=Diploscapter pachys TaxID=2018661 RepID=A0A2A2JG08_9BILA|nr:hypothetical protein WR25_02914 [Diploscapter pachys]
MTVSPSSSKRKWSWILARNIAAYWILGLCNNYGYVIMLSAAEDILDEQHGKTTNGTTKDDQCMEHIDNRHCSRLSTGAVLLADNIPCLVVQTLFPFFMDRFPFGARAFAVILLQAASYFVVAYSNSIAMSLVGVCLSSLGQGIGEITFLAMSAHYPPSTVGAWSSGTGGAGLIGSFSYALLTEPKMGNLSPKTTLLIQLFIPALYAVAYFLILTSAKTIYSPTFNPKTWIVPSGYYSKKDSSQREIISSLTDSKSRSSSDGGASNREVSSPITTVSEVANLDSNDITRNSGSDGEYTEQRKLNLFQRLELIVPLIPLMAPLAVVYFAEYMINQGLTELIFFNCAKGAHLTQASQYRWYQVLYQLGVFLSRSSIHLFELPLLVILFLPILQLVNMVFFFFEAVYWFLPSIFIVFGLIVFEGLLGGMSYVNTYNHIHKKVEPDIREFSLSAALMGNSLGINIAAFLAIPLHNWVCGMSVPSGR